MYPNHQFSPTPSNNSTYATMNGMNGGGGGHAHHHHVRNNQQQPVIMNQYQYLRQQNMPNPNPNPRPGRNGPRLRPSDSLGNVIILPNQYGMGLCSGCHNIFGQDGQTHHQQVGFDVLDGGQQFWPLFVNLIND